MPGGSPHIAQPPSRSTSARRCDFVKRRFSRPQSRIWPAVPRTQGMMEPPAAIRRAVAMLTGWLMPSIRAWPSPDVEVFEAHPNDDSRSAERDVGRFAAEHVPGDHHECIELTLGDGAHVGIGVGSSMRVVERGTEVGCHDRFDRGLDRRTRLDIALAVEVEHSVALVHHQVSLASSIALFRLEPVGVEVRFGPGDQFGELIQAHADGLLRQNPFGGVERIPIGTQCRAVEHGDDCGCGIHADLAGVVCGSDEGVSGRRGLAGERRSRCGGFSHLHQPLRVARRGSRGGGDQDCGVAKTLLLGQAIAAQLGP